MSPSELNKLLNQLENCSDIDYAKTLVARILDGRSMEAMDGGTHILLYRSVPWPEPRKEVKDLSYPPSEFVKLGRCNREGQPTFYCSSHISACVVELKNPKPGDKIILGQWRCSHMFYMVPVGYTDEQYASRTKHPELHLKHLKNKPKDIKKIDARFHKYFTHAGDKYYKQSTAIAEGFLNAAKDRPEQYIIRYPSVEHPNKDLTPDNLAFPSDFVDQFFNLESAICIEITSVSDKGTEYIQTHHSKKIENGLIEWETSKSWLIPPKTAYRIKMSHENVTATDSSGNLVKPQPIDGFIDNFPNPEQQFNK